MKHLKLFFALFAMLALGVGNAWGAEAEVYSADFTSVATHSYTQNKTFTLNSKSWTSSVSQVNSKVFYLGCNSSNKTKGVLNDNSTFSEIVTALKSVDSKYSANVSTAHAYAMLFDNAYTNVTRVSFGWAGGNNAFQVYLFGYSNSSWSLLKQTNYATSGTAVAGSVEWTGEATDYTKFAIVARPGTATSVASNKTLRASTFKIYATEDAGSGEPEPVIVKTLKSIAVTGMKTTYEQGDIFKFNGTCTATYSVTKDGVAQPDETAEVTPTSVSTPNMNTIGTPTVTVTYSEGGVEKTAEYQITITENTVTAGEYCITPNNEFWGTNFNGTISGDALNQVYTGRQDDITVQYSKGSGSNLYINNTQTRTYNGTALTIFAPNGYVITAIAFTADGSNWAGTHTANVGTMTDSKNWAGSANEVTITFGGTCRVTKICVTYEAAPVEPVKTLTSIEITTPATQTTFWQGETFNYNGLVVTAHYSDAADEVITPTVTGSTATAGTATVTVSYKEQSTSYAITVKAIPNTKETAYSVAEAYDIIDKLTTAEGVFISGIISQVDSYNETYKSITYWISANGTTTKQLQVYSGKGLESADFEGETDLSIGDQVIVCGNLKNYYGTYEFDKNNYLASYTPTTKDPADLAYAATSYTANVGEAFTTPELTNPHNLAVTYSTSDASKATVDANTGAVTIVAAGVVTITAATTGDATHDAGSASYNITITDPSLLIATLPFEFNGKQADIEGTAGMTHSGIDADDYKSAPYLKMNTTGDWLIICFDSEPEKLSYDIKNNSFSGGKFSVQESADGETYTDVAVHTTITDLQSEEYELNSASRYVKFIYTTKSSGNVGLGNIKITEPDNRADAGLAWNPATVSLTVGDAFTAPTLNNPNSVSGITFTSDNEALATVNAGVISLVSGKTGIATITATYAGNETYKPAEVTCVVSVSPKSEKVVILAEREGQWYALKAEYLSGKADRLVAIPVDYFNGTLYNVAEEVKATIEWNSIVEGDKVSFLNDGKYLKGKTSTTLIFEAGEDGLYQWDNTTYTMTIGGTVRSFLYNGEAFRNFATSNAGKVVNEVLYSSLPVVTTPVYSTEEFVSVYTRDVTPGNYGTICLPYASDNFTGATFFKVAGKEGNKIVFDEVTALEAGKPYIFLAEATEIKVAQIGTAELTAQRYNSLQGTFTQINPAVDNVLVDNYMIFNNVIKMCGVNCGLQAYRAYFIAGELESLGAPSARVPGRRRVAIGQAPQVATGVDQVQGDEVPTKMIINGQLFILRGEKMYDAQGKLVK